MKRTRCTAFVPVTPDKNRRCGRLDDCTRVVVKAGNRKIKHYVCAECRKRMKLPEHDTTYTPHRTLGAKS